MPAKSKNKKVTIDWPSYGLVIAFALLSLVFLAMTLWR